MISKEILKQVKRIEIKTGRLVSETFAGQYESTFKGRGMEFAEVREYTPGDDIRTIDWNVTARVGKPFIKKFVEERELTVVFLVDFSGSGQFGTAEKFKNEIAVELVSLLALSATKNNDKVGMIGFTDIIEKFITPKKGKKHILRIVREMISFAPKSKGTNIKAALQYLNEVTKRKAVVFLVSDFLDRGFEKDLKITAQKHDLIAIRITDDLEQALPSAGFLEIEDGETGEMAVIDTSDASFVKKFKESRSDELATLKRLFKSAKVDNIDIFTGKPYTKPLINFFRARALRLR
ncbi:MAG: hypothetical protein A2231_08395 [Candidatus Firestonebacteria bacterium RIFOXYA2_FULL_40_8]|nr:MAG: hypothetical protein A2231_08395 [Candidatus Firestonebacteria bacterium RIFOXYA2_FULL_40_8]